MKPSDSRQTCCDSARSWQILGFLLTFQLDQHGRDRWREYWRDVFEPTCSRTCKSNLGPTPRGYGSLAIRGRRAVTRHDLGKLSAFFHVSDRPTRERSLEGVLKGRFRGNIPKKPAKVSKNRPQTLPKRTAGRSKSSLEPSKTLFLKEISFKKAQEGLSRSFWGPKWSTWFHLGGPRPSQIEAKTSKNRC